MVNVLKSRILAAWLWGEEQLTLELDLDRSVTP